MAFVDAEVRSCSLPAHSTKLLCLIETLVSIILYGDDKNIIEIQNIENFNKEN